MVKKWKVKKSDMKEMVIKKNGKKKTVKKEVW